MADSIGEHYFFMENECLPPDDAYRGYLLVFNEEGKVVYLSDRINQIVNPYYMLLHMLCINTGSVMALVWGSKLSTSNCITFTSVAESDLVRDRIQMEELLNQEGWELNALNFLLNTAKMPSADELAEDEISTEMTIVRLRAMSHIMEWKRFLDKSSWQSEKSLRFLEVLDNAKENLFELISPMCSPDTTPGTADA